MSYKKSKYNNKRQRLTEGFKNMIHLYAVLEKHIKYNYIGRLILNVWEKIYHANMNQKKKVVAI